MAALIVVLVVVLVLIMLGLIAFLINATRYPALSAYAVDVRRIARARYQVRYA